MMNRMMNRNGTGIFHNTASHQISDEYCQELYTTFYLGAKTHLTLLDFCGEIPTCFIHTITSHSPYTRLKILLNIVIN